MALKVKSSACKQQKKKYLKIEANTAMVKLLDKNAPFCLLLIHLYLDLTLIHL